MLSLFRTFALSAFNNPSFSFQAILHEPYNIVLAIQCSIILATYGQRKGLLFIPDVFAKSFLALTLSLSHRCYAESSCNCSSKRSPLPSQSDKPISRSLIIFFLWKWGLLSKLCWIGQLWYLNLQSLQLLICFCLNHGNSQIRLQNAINSLLRGWNIKAVVHHKKWKEKKNKKNVLIWGKRHVLDWINEFCVAPHAIWVSSVLLFSDVFLMFKCKNGSYTG